MTHPSQQAGRAARQRAPRSAHALWEAAPDRRDPVATLERQAETRTPELVPVRYGRMARSPFAFFRGAGAIMAADLAATPVTGLQAQLCGDAHLTNFGVFAAPDRSLVFDLNDFDESLPGPWEWDLKRLAASFEIAARENGYKHGERREVVRAVARRYREAVREFAAMRNLDVWYARLDVDTIMQAIQSTAGGRAVKKARKAEAKARAKDSIRALGRLSRRVEGELRFVSDPPLVVPLDELLEGAAR